MNYRSDQELNRYAEMLHSIYGPSQNYAKTKYEILCHLSEVCGIAGKQLLKKRDFDSADRFIPKIFGWMCALVRAVDPDAIDLEQIVLEKYPGACPYCLEPKCSCWKAEKPNLQPDKLRALAQKKIPSMRRTVDDFETMFRTIYEHTWRGKSGEEDPINYTYMRLIEELAEVTEAVRFFHLYPENFENEIADLISWWFALGYVLREERGGAGKVTSELLWRAYPGHCKDCESAPCFCPQAPVRELMSKPSPGAIGETDGLTSLRNQLAYEGDLKDFKNGRIVSTFPAICVRADVDDFKSVNTKYGHHAADEALKHIASILRSKARPKDRVYRTGGDEFGIIMPDFTEREAEGLFARVIKAVRETPVRWVGSNGEVILFTVSLSVGIANCEAPTEVKLAFEGADAAAFESKNQGKNRITLYSSMDKNGRLL